MIIILTKLAESAEIMWNGEQFERSVKTRFDIEVQQEEFCIDTVSEAIRCFMNQKFGEEPHSEKHGANIFCDIQKGVCHLSMVVGGLLLKNSYVLDVKFRNEDVNAENNTADKIISVNITEYETKKENDNDCRIFSE